MTVEQRITALRKRRRLALEKHANAVRSATEELDEQLAKIDGRLAELKAWSQDPSVLVRNGPGPRVEVYHSAEDSCGKVNPVMVQQGRFDEMPLGEAVGRGLRPCSACATLLRSGAA